MTTLQSFTSLGYKQSHFISRFIGKGLPLSCYWKFKPSQQCLWQRYSQCTMYIHDLQNWSWNRQRVLFFPLLTRQWTWAWQPRSKDPLTRWREWMHARTTPKLPKAHFGNNDNISFSCRVTLELADPGLRNLSERLICISHPTAVICSTES